MSTKGRSARQGEEEEEEEEKDNLSSSSRRSSRRRRRTRRRRRRRTMRYAKTSGCPACVGAWPLKPLHEKGGSCECVGPFIASAVRLPG